MEPELELGLGLEPALVLELDVGLELELVVELELGLGLERARGRWSPPRFRSQILPKAKSLDRDFNALLRYCGTFKSLRLCQNKNNL